MKRYILTIYSNSTHGREYDVTSRNVMKLAYQYGRCEFGEVVSVYTPTGKLVSRAHWTPEDGGRYYRG